MGEWSLVQAIFRSSGVVFTKLEMPPKCTLALFPHFWAIGWMMYDDYKRVGIYMLPTGQKDRGTALQIILYTLWTIVVSITPVWGITGNLSLSVPAAIMVAICGICMLLAALRLYQKQDTLAAKRLLFVSILYISVIQIIYVIDKFI